MNLHLLCTELTEMYGKTLRIEASDPPQMQILHAVELGILQAQLNIHGVIVYMFTAKAEPML